MAGKKTALKQPRVINPEVRAAELCDELGAVFAEKEAIDEKRKVLSEELLALAAENPDLMGEQKSFNHGGVEVRFESKQVAVMVDETKYNGAALATRFPLLFPIGMSNSKIEKAFENDETRIVLASYGIGLETSEKFKIGKKK
jgi:hypothetical protein